MKGEERKAISNRIVFVSLGVNVILTAIKALAGLLAGSRAMVADAVHSASDIVSSLVVFIGVRLGSRPADFEHQYGHAKLESVTAKIVALILGATGLTLGWSAIQALRSGRYEVPGSLALAAAVVSIAAKEGLFRYAHAVGKKINSQAIIADAWHNRSDALSSVAALVGLLGARLGYTWADAAAGAAVSLLILKVGVELYYNAIKELIDTAPDRETMEKIIRACCETKGVMNVNDVKARKIGSGIHIDLRICVNRFITVEQGHDIAEGVERAIQLSVPNAEEIMVHINPCSRVSAPGEISIFCDKCENNRSLYLAPLLEP